MIRIAGPLSWAGSLIACLVFAYVPVGSAVPNPELPSLGGASTHLLADHGLTVFVFIDPGQEHTVTLLKGLKSLTAELARRPVRWTLVASDRFTEEEVTRALESSELDLPVVVDVGDELYGQLGVRLYPSVGIVDEEHLLQAYLPFTKINYVNSIRAHVLHGLGEIDDAELEAALDPSASSVGGSGASAERSLRFARMLLEAGKLDKARAQAEHAVAAAPDRADAHALLGAIEAAAGDCSRAGPHLDTALELDPDEPTALRTRTDCGS